mgnify:CR=1 FL=1
MSISMIPLRNSTSIRSKQQRCIIDAAAEAGIDCAKFQSYKAGTIVSKNSPAYLGLDKGADKDPI